MKITRLTIAICLVSSLCSPLLRADRGEGGGAPRIPGYQSLSPEEQEKVKAASQKASTDAAVAAAQAKVQAAEAELREAREKALLDADPSLAPILEKLKQAAAQGRGPRGEEGASRRGQAAPGEERSASRRGEPAPAGEQPAPRRQ